MIVQIISACLLAAEPGPSPQQVRERLVLETLDGYVSAGQFEEALTFAELATSKWGESSDPEIAKLVSAAKAAVTGFTQTKLAVEGKGLVGLGSAKPAELLVDVGTNKGATFVGFALPATGGDADLGVTIEILGTDKKTVVNSKTINVRLRWGGTGIEQRDSSLAIDSFSTPLADRLREPGAWNSLVLDWRPGSSVGIQLNGERLGSIDLPTLSPTLRGLEKGAVFDLSRTPCRLRLSLSPRVDPTALSVRAYTR